MRTSQIRAHAQPRAKWPLKPVRSKQKLKRSKILPEFQYQISWNAVFRDRRVLRLKSSRMWHRVDRICSNEHCFSSYTIGTRSVPLWEPTMSIPVLSRTCTQTDRQRFKVCNGAIRGHVVAQLVEALCYKSEGCGFDSRLCHWNFSLT